jgi:hypothetical protein
MAVLIGMLPAACVAPQGGNQGSGQGASQGAGQGAAAAGAAAVDPQRQPGGAMQLLNTLTEAERAAGWQLLFDGRTTQGWRAYKGTGVPQGWQAVDGALTRVARAGDIITVDRFRNFDLVLEWKLSPEGGAGNSGIFYRAIEGEGPIYHYAPEYQILDNARHPDGRSELTSAGANYGLHPAPHSAARPIGEWNSTRIVVRGNHVEHWLNGVKTADYELLSPDWEAKVAGSKFNDWPRYGRSAEGHIGLQEHGSFVAFRNIKIRALP